MPLLLDSLDSGNLILIGIVFIVGIAIQMWIIRSACKIEEQIKHQQAMILLLIKLCEKQGVEPTEIENIKQRTKLV